MRKGRKFAAPMPVGFGCGAMFGQGDPGEDPSRQSGMSEYSCTGPNTPLVRYAAAWPRGHPQNWRRIGVPEGVRDQCDERITRRLWHRGHAGGRSSSGRGSTDERCCACRLRSMPRTLTGRVLLTGFTHSTVWSGNQSGLRPGPTACCDTGRSPHSSLRWPGEAATRERHRQ